jgi:hypothetical protein
MNREWWYWAGFGVSLAMPLAAALWKLRKCRHRITWPITMTWPDGKRRTTISCLRCSREYLYDVDTWQIGKEVEEWLQK